MGFLSVLKAIGKGAATVLGVLNVARTVAAPYLPANVSTFLQRAAESVARAEQAANTISAIGTSIGGQGKLALADAFFAESLDIAELASGREIGDNDKYKRGVDAILEGRKLILSGVADVMDSLKNK